MMFFKQHRDKINALLLLLLFVSYLGSITLFPHTHIANGHTVTHSHPYSGTPDSPGHGHTSEQLIAISFLTSLIAIAFVILGLEKIYRKYSFLFLPKTVSYTKVEDLISNSLRGPPVC